MDKKKKKLFSVIITSLIMLFNLAGHCLAENDGKMARIIERQAKASGVDDIKNELEKYLDSDGLELIKGFSSDELIKDATDGTLGTNLKGFGEKALKILFRELYRNLGIVIKLAVLIIICSLLKNLQAGFMSEGVSQVAFCACYIVLVSILLAGFDTVMKMGTDIIDKMIGFMYFSMPVVLTLLISSGNVAAGGILHPVMLMIIEVSATVIRHFFIPLVFMSTILAIVNNLSEKIQLTRLANLIKQIITWSMGILLTVFIIAVMLQGTLGAVVDGTTSKAAKFAISTFIPVVGKTLADAADTVIGCTLLIKNAAGVAVMAGILVICVVPLIKIIAIIALYKTASAMLEPISEIRITNCINEVAGSMLYVFALVASVAFMFVISVTALISAGNMSAMLR